MIASRFLPGFLASTLAFSGACLVGQGGASEFHTRGAGPGTRAWLASFRRASQAAAQLETFRSHSALSLTGGTGGAAPPVASSRQATEKAEKKMSPYTSNLRTTSQFSREEFVPDGNLDKPVWKKARWVKFDHDASGQRHFPQAETQVASLWTATNVYFAFRCHYSTLNIYEGEDPARERWELWNRDVAEVFLNPQPERVNHYYEFEVAPNNQWIDLEIDLDKTPMNDAAWNSGFEHATRVDAQKKVWSCEMRIPLRALGVRRMEPNSEWRINFYRCDGPSDETERRFLAWSTIPGEKPSFHVPTRFGLIRFVQER